MTKLAQPINHMMLLLLLAISAVLLASSRTEAKIFTKCDLAKELGKSGISRTFYSHWICLANAESGLDTTKVTKMPNTSTSYGIFQINSKDYCREGRKGGVCNMKCEDFLNDNLADDIDCVKNIQMMKGFQAWAQWVKKCKNNEKALPDLSKCRI